MTNNIQYQILNILLYSLVMSSIKIINNYICRYLNNELHSINDIPAVESLDGKDLQWFKHGKLHRDNDINGNSLPALVQDKNYP